jgi:hypothetical protein
MQTIVTLPIAHQPDRATLFLDVVTDPPGVTIYRQDAGLVHIEPGEIGLLISTLMSATVEIVPLLGGKCCHCGRLAHWLDMAGRPVCNVCGIQDENDG